MNAVFVEMMLEVVIIVALVVANGVFAGAEIAIVALRHTRVRELVDEGRSGARSVLRLRNEPERFLATVQVGITVLGATAAAFGGESFATRLAPRLETISWIGEHAEAVALIVVVAALSFLSIVVGELVPKSLALRKAERYALLVATPLWALAWLVRPLVWSLSASANILLRPFGDKTTFTETRHSAEELQQLVDEATKAGTIHPDAGEIASRALELPELTVMDVMVPRHDVVMVARRAPAEQVRRILLEHTHSRMPVFEGRVDNVVGYISVRDLLALAWEQQLIVLEDVMRPPFFVPESQKAVELLRQMRARHLPFAIVVDERGSATGIVTIEDLMEELVGEIFSEHAAPTQNVRHEADGSIIVMGTTPIRELNRELNLELPEDGNWTTIAGLCLFVAGRIPATGETIDLPNGPRVQILDATPHRIRSLRIKDARPRTVAM